jgi:hypothetical protein
MWIFQPFYALWEEYHEMSSGNYRAHRTGMVVALVHAMSWEIVAGIRAVLVLAR